MSKKKIFLVIAIVILALVVTIGALCIFLPENEQDKTQNTTESSQTQEIENNTEVSKEDSSTEPTKENLDNTPTKPIKQELHNTPTDDTYFPYEIPETPLVINKIDSFDGTFLEDGSDKIIENVTAIELTNTSDMCIDYMEITIERDGALLQFNGSALGPNSTVVILEANATQFSKGEYSNCRAEIATSEEMEMSEEQVRVEETDGKDLLVTNITGKDIPCVRIFYKYYMDDSDVYLGGITYTAKIVDLAAGKSCKIMPSHYTKGDSKIVMVKTYESAD